MSALATYSFTGPSFNATSSNGNLTAGAVTNASLTSCITDTPGYAADPVLVAGPANTATNVANAVSTNSYFSFTITVGAGKKINLQTLTFNAARGGAATPRGYALRSSIDAYAADIATADLLTQRTTFTPVSVDLSGASYQKLTAITFRMYVYAPATTNTVDFDSIIVNGALSAGNMFGMFR